MAAKLLATCSSHPLMTPLCLASLWQEPRQAPHAIAVFAPILRRTTKVQQHLLREGWRRLTGVICSIVLLRWYIWRLDFLPWHLHNGTCVLSAVKKPRHNIDQAIQMLPCKSFWVNSLHCQKVSTSNCNSSSGEFSQPTTGINKNGKALKKSLWRTGKHLFNHTSGSSWQPDYP